MLRKIVIIISLSLLFIARLQAQILPIYSIESSEFANLKKTIDSNSLVLINIDNILITPKSKMFLYRNNPQRSFFNILVDLAKSKPHFNEPLKILLKERQMGLVEQGWPKLIKILRSRGTYIFGLSDIDHKICDLIVDIEKWRYDQLTQLNIHFQEEIANEHFILLDHSSYKSPIFYKGIISTGSSNYEETIMNFLRINNIFPNKIIIFDDEIDRLKAIKLSLSRFDIDFYGIHYLGLQEISGVANEELIRFQQDMLLSQSKWLEDDEAEQLLRDSKQ
ncbi:MAG: DUF2608 domain-containing protein [Janthinobacterium lividum]